MLSGTRKPAAQKKRKSPMADAPEKKRQRTERKSSPGSAVAPKSKRAPKKGAAASAADSGVAEIRTALWDHQSDCVDKMCQRERDMFDLQQNLGVLCEDMGGGKTLTVLAALVKQKRVQTDYTAHLSAHSTLLAVLLPLVQQYLELDPAGISQLWVEVEDTLAQSEPALIYGGTYPRLFYNPFSIPVPNIAPARGAASFAALADNDDNDNDNDADSAIEMTALSGVQSDTCGTKMEKATSDPTIASSSSKALQPHTVLDTSLVVVPFHLFRQWRDELTKHTRNVKCHLLHSTRDAMDVNVFAKHDLVLCNSNKYNLLARYCNSNRICWQRVVFDETHAVRIARCEPIAALFYWAVTTTYTALHSINRHGFLRHLFARLTLEQLQQLCVQAEANKSDARCFGSFPPYVKYTIKCRTSPHSLIINALYPQTPLSQFVNEQQDDRAIEYLLACIRQADQDASAYGQQESVAPAVLREMSLLELKFVHLAQSRRSQYGSHVADQRNTLIKAIRLHRICVHCLADVGETEYESTCCGLPYCAKCCDLMCANCWEARVHVVAVDNADDDDESDDMFDEAERKTSRDQRKRLQHEQLYQQYHIRLLARQTKNAQRRTQLDTAQLRSHVDNYTVQKCAFIEDNKLDKFEACEQILERVKNQRTLIFVNTSRTNRRLENVFKRVGVRSSEVKYQASVIAKRLLQLKTHELQVLVLNQRHVGTGLSIHDADNIIIVSVDSMQRLMQDIARAQRPGRSGVLSVYVLE